MSSLFLNWISTRKKNNAIVIISFIAHFSLFCFLSFLYQCTRCAHQLWQFNDAEDTGIFSNGVNSSEINVYDTSKILWTRTQFHKSVHEVEVTVTGDNTFFFGATGNISLNVRMDNIKFNKYRMMRSTVKFLNFSNS